MKILRTLILLGVCFIAVAGVITYLWVRHYIYTPTFTSDIETLANKSLDGTVTIAEVDPENWGFKTEQIKLENEGKIELLEINGFETKFKKWALLRRVWHMDKLVCDELTVSILRKKPKPPVSNSEPTKDKQPPLTEQLVETSPDTPAPPKETSKAPKKKPKSHKPLFHKVLPNQVEFDKISVGKFSGEVERRKRNIEWHDIGLDGSIKKQLLDLKLEGGSVKIPLKILADWNFDQGRISTTEDFFTIHEAHFTQPSGGKAKLSGNGDYSGDLLSLSLDLLGIPVSSLLSDETANQILTGNISGTAKAFEQGGDTIVKGNLFLNDGVLTLPDILKPLTKLLGDESLNKIDLTRCVADVRHVGDNTILDNLFLEANEVFAVTGRVELLDDRYRGLCRFGLKESTYKKLPANLASSFSEHEGYYWIPVRLSGEKDDFVKDISLKLAKAIGGGLISKGSVLDKLGESVNHILNDDSELGKELNEKADELLNKGINALQKLFK